MPVRERRSRAHWALRLVVVAVVGLALLAAAWFVGYPRYRPPLRDGEALGVDVSHHQGDIDWARVAADGVEFAYIKATEGGTVADPRFRRNWQEAAAAGIRRGAYHYFTLCRPGADQAAYFLQIAPPDRHALPPAVDLELAGNCTRRPSPHQVAVQLEAFLTALRRGWGRDAVLYVGDDWQARYPVPARAGQRWSVSFLGRPDNRWAVWQVHWRAHVDGVHGPVDLDVGRLADLRAE